MGRPPKIKKITDEEILRALEKSMGFYGHAAKALGINRRTITRRMEESEELRKGYADIVESQKDMAEISLLGAVRDRESWAVCFYLKTKARDRGYIERKEVDLDVKQSPKVELVLNAPGTASAPE